MQRTISTTTTPSSPSTTYEVNKNEVTNDAATKAPVRIDNDDDDDIDIVVSPTTTTLGDALIPVRNASSFPTAADGSDNCQPGIPMRQSQLGSIAIGTYTRRNHESSTIGGFNNNTNYPRTALGLSLHTIVDDNDRREQRQHIITDLTSIGTVARQTNGTIQVGQCIRKVNNVDCSQLVQEDVMALLNGVYDEYITIIAENDNVTTSSSNDTVMYNDSFMTGTIVRENATQKLGIGFRSGGGDGHHTISSIDEHGGGLVGLQTDLQVGDVVVQIDMDSCRQMSVQQVTTLLRTKTAIVGVLVTLVVQASTTITVTIQRDSPIIMLGLSMQRDEHDRLIISNIMANGVVSMMQTDLQVGDVVLQIGDVVDCHDLSAVDAMLLVNELSLTEPDGVTLTVDVLARRKLRAKRRAYRIEQAARNEIYNKEHKRMVERMVRIMIAIVLTIGTGVAVGFHAGRRYRY